jgi:hypothetical protein
LLDLIPLFNDNFGYKYLREDNNDIVPKNRMAKEIGNINALTLDLPTASHFRTDISFNNQKALVSLWP